MRHLLLPHRCICYLVYYKYLTISLMKIASCLIFIFLVTVHAHFSHTYNCVFDENNHDLTHQAATSKPAVGLHSSGPRDGRLLFAPTRIPMRIHLDSTAFGTINPGVNGATTTTMTNLNFILRTMQVAVAFFQNRLQVGQMLVIYSPTDCVDFQPPAADNTTGIPDVELVIYAQYLTDTTKGYGATGKSCNYFQGTATSLSPDSSLQAGRPTVGRIIFNTYNLVDRATTLTDLLFQSVTSTAIHETMHILGFDSTLYDTFLDPNLGYPYASTTIINSSIVNSQRPKTNIITTPFVTAWARAFFGCPSLPGMLLQNQDSTAAGGGSHWQRTAMYDQLMTATSFGAAKGMSGLTFALLKDTGWYTVDDTFSETSNYGYQQGCSFVLDACYNNTSYAEFCNSVTQNNVSYCQTNFYSKAICDNTSTLMSDGCGLYGPYFNCVDDTSTDPGYQALTYEQFGTNTLCVASTLSTQLLLSNSNLLSRCYPYVCDTSSIVFTIGSYSITCLSSQAGVMKTLSALTGYLTCPDYNDFCVQSRKTCKNWCSQNGYCTGGVCNCYTGFAGTDCSTTLCSGSTYYDSSSNTCAATCPAGTYPNIYAWTCLACVAPCSTCVTLPTNCLSCISSIANPQFYYNNQCSSTCPSSTYTSGSSCIACDIPSNCATCTSSSTFCTSCLNGKYLSHQNSGVCVTSCVTNPYLLTDQVNLVCVSLCPNYTRTVGSTCTLCTNGTYYSVGTCISTCPNQTYANTTYRVCYGCDSSCLLCNGPYPQNCTSCQSGSSYPYFLLKMCWATCPKGFYANPVTGNCEVCPVQLSCTACAYSVANAAAYCTSCSYGTFFNINNSTCTISCPSNQYQNNWNSSCNSCNPLCAQCNGPFINSCVACLGSFFLLTNGTGGYCVISCPTGYTQTGGTCQSCDNTCNACNGVSASQCVNCSSGYYLSNGSNSYCKFICPNGTYPDSVSQQCLNCDSTCSYCFGGMSQNCTFCATGLYLYNFTCTNTCPNGMSPNQWNICKESFFSLSLTLLLILFLMIKV